MDEPGGLRKAARLIRQHHEVGKVGLGFLCVVKSLDRDYDHARVPLRKIAMAPFELNQLGHADRSPPAAEEHKNAVLIAGQVALGERRAVSSAGFERREWTSHRDWPRVRGQSRCV